MTARTVPSRRRAVTRDRILEAARDAFAEKGVGGASVEDICERAGYTRGAFYSNFSDKHELVLAMLEADTARSLDALDAAIHDEGPLSVETVIDRFIAGTSIDRRRLLVQNEMSLWALREETRSAAYARSQRATRERLGALVVDGLARVGRRPAVPVEELTETVSAVVERSIRRAHLEGALSRRDELSRSILPRLLDALTEPVPG